MSAQASRTVLGVGLFALNLVLGLSLFFVSQSAQQTEITLSKLDRTLEAENKTISLLQAEWAYLTRAPRLEALMASRVEETQMAKAAALTALVAPAAKESPEKTATVKTSAPVKLAAVQNETSTPSTTNKAEPTIKAAQKPEAPKVMAALTPAPTAKPKKPAATTPVAKQAMAPPPAQKPKQQKDKVATAHSKLAQADMNAAYTPPKKATSAYKAKQSAALRTASLSAPRPYVRSAGLSRPIVE